MSKPNKKFTQSTQKKTSNQKSKLEPLGDRVLIRPFTEEDLRRRDGKKPVAGIILPESMTEQKSAQGKVLAVGEGRWENGSLVPVRVKVGDKVVFSKYSYDEIEHEGEELFLLKEENILAIIK